jgi:periplasmic divalent cation tolerance protein
VGKSFNLGRGPSAFCVAMAKRAEPQVVAAREPLVFPAEPVPSDVVVAAARGQVYHIGPSGLGPGLDVIDVTFGGGHTASGSDAGQVTQFHVSLLAGVRTAFRGPDVGRHPGFRVGYPEPPLRASLLFGDLTGDVGDNRAETCQLAGTTGQTCQRLQIDMEVDGAGSLRLVSRVPAEKIEGDIGSKLVHRPGLTRHPQRFREAVDAIECSRRSDGCDIAQDDVGRSVEGWLTDNAALFKGGFVSFLGRFRLNFEAQFLNLRSKFSSGQLGCPTDHLIDDLARLAFGEVLGAVYEDTGATDINLAGPKGFADFGKSMLEDVGKVDFDLRHPPGQTQCRTKLHCSCVHTELHFTIEFDHEVGKLGDVLIGPSRVMRRHLLMCLEHQHLVMARQLGGIDYRKEGGQFRPGLPVEKACRESRLLVLFQLALEHMFESYKVAVTDSIPSTSKSKKFLQKSSIMSESGALVLVTCGSEDEARGIARHLVEARLAAGVQIIPISSIYTWEDEVVEDREHLLICKTRTALYDDIESTVTEHHSYDVPPILMLEIDRASSRYSEWIRVNTGQA